MDNKIINEEDKLNKEDIINIISQLELLDKYHFVFMGGSLTVMGIREYTNDLDLGVTSDEFYKLHEKFGGEISISALQNKKLNLIIDNHKVEIFNLDEKKIYDNIDNVKCQKLFDIIELKKKLNRPKDRSDLKIIYDFMNK